MNRIASSRSRVLRRAFRHMLPGHIVKSSLTRRTIQRIANRLGFVYFGFVSQRDDDHKLVRGHTVSGTHIDNHYCLGTIQGYDTTIVTRNDVIVTRKATEQRVHWLIVTFDLHTRYDIPHIYIGHRAREEAFSASYEELKAIIPGTYAPYDKKFLEDYTLYASPSRALDVERIIPAETAHVIASRFRGASIEIEDNIVYLYIESQHPSEVLIEKLLENGLWFAQIVDGNTTLMMQPI